MRIDRIEFNLSKANRAEFFLPESEANPPLMMLVFDKEHIKNASKAYIEVQNLFGSHDITVSVRKKTSGAGISIISESKSEVINPKPMKAKGFIKFKEGLSKGTP